MVITLKTLIRKLQPDTRLLQQVLTSFSCTQDIDITSFLHFRAVEFERLSKSRTYLIIDEISLKQGTFTILGYFSIALKTLSIPETLSNRARKELDGFSGKIHGEPIQNIPCYLIGQLARDSSTDAKTLPGSTILSLAYDIIAAAVNLVGGRYIMIECRNNDNLIQFYKHNHFTEIAHISDGTVPMVQMIRKIESFNFVT